MLLVVATLGVDLEVIVACLLACVSVCLSVCVCVCLFVCLFVCGNEVFLCRDAGDMILGCV